jgi:hypothetical protein
MSIGSPMWSLPGAGFLTGQAYVTLQTLSTAVPNSGNSFAAPEVLCHLLLSKELGHIRC